MNDKHKAILGLFLVGLAPTFSVVSSFGTGDGLLGQIAWVTSKLWMFGLPLLWRTKIDVLPISWSRPNNGGYRDAVIIGTIFSLIMILAWLIVGKDSVDYATFSKSLEPFGLTNPTLYIGAALFWILINSVLEEYVFRWFIVEKAELLFKGMWATVFFSASIFVLHHFFALHFLGFSIWVNLLACLGLFIGGSAFSWLYVKYRSIWIPYITHAMCDIVVFGIGWVILF
ncbi:MAG: type II CAAX endopeptidase family protein [Candidatus Poseidoniaceae archaeon]|jgi:hypothetical protein|nr:type II CAAX endopeptidase family protein [Candidatus Poseidoniaceae archaeon]